MPDVADAIKAALSVRGAPYVWGATGPRSFDCSGLTQWAWRAGGIQLPRTSQQQATFGTEVPLAKIAPGDLVTSDWGGGPSSHVGLYIGSGRLVHAPRPGRTVTVAKLNADYQRRINHIRRPPGVKGGATQADFDPRDLIPGPGGLLLGPPGLALDGLGQFFDKDGKLLDGSDVLGALSAAAGWIGQSLNAIGKSMMSVGDLATWILKLGLPSTWVRITSGLMGVVLLFLGLHFLAREARGAA